MQYQLLISSGIRGLLVASLLLTLGCAEKSTPLATSPLFAELSVALEADIDSPTCPWKVGYPDIKSMRLRLFSGTPESLEDTVAAFDTSSVDIAQDGCLSFVQCAGASVIMDQPSSMNFDEKVEACIDAGGSLIPATLINVQELEASTGMTAYLELFSGVDCDEEDLAFVSMRGELEVAPEEPQSVHMTPLCKGHFTTLPTPINENTGFLRDLALTECERDCDCVEPFKDILKKECTESQLEADIVPGAPVHCVNSRCSADYGFEWLLQTECDGNSDCVALFPNSVCGSAGYCDVTSYYPLEPNRAMAFHSSAVLPDGSIALVGGFNKSEDGRFIAEDTSVLRFNPHTLVFEEKAPVDIESGETTGGLNRAMHATILDDTTGVLVLSGGIQNLEVAFKADDEGIRRLILAAKLPGEDESESYVDSIAVLGGDMTGENVSVRITPIQVSVDGEFEAQPIALQVVEKVLNSGKAEFLFSGGVAPEKTAGTTSVTAGLDTAPYANMAMNCVFSSNLKAKCLVNRGVFVNPRGAANGTCFSWNDEGLCTGFATLGGANSTEARVGELFASSTEGTNGKFVKLASDGADGLRRAKFVQSKYTTQGSHVVFGGGDQKTFGGPPNVPTMVLTLEGPDTDEPTLVAEPVSGNISFGGIEATFRNHQATVELEDGDILVTGGLNNQNLTTSLILIFDTETEKYRNATLQLSRARFGHQATRIEAGLLKGSVLVTGGLSANTEDSTPSFVRTAEIFVP